MKRTLLFIIIAFTVMGCRQSAAPMNDSEALSAFSAYDAALTDIIKSNASDCHLLGSSLLELIKSHHEPLRRAFSHLNAMDRYTPEGQAFIQQYEESRPSRHDRTLMKAIDDCGKAPDIKEFKRIYSELMLSDLVPKSI